MRGLLFALALPVLTGCGSLLSAIDAEPIPEDPGRRTMGNQVEDQVVETKAKVNIHAASEALDGAHISVISYNGYLLLVGQVPDEASRELAAQTAQEVRGVRRIYNELEIAGNSSALTRTSDTLLTAKVKSYLLARDDIEGNRVKVVTENGVVYLMGLVARSEGDRISEAVRESGGVQKVVQVFEYLD